MRQQLLFINRQQLNISLTNLFYHLACKWDSSDPASQDQSNRATIMDNTTEWNARYPPKSARNQPPRNNMHNTTESGTSSGSGDSDSGEPANTQTNGKTQSDDGCVCQWRARKLPDGRYQRFLVFHCQRPKCQYYMKSRGKGKQQPAGNKYRAQGKAQPAADDDGQECACEMGDIKDMIEGGTFRRPVSVATKLRDELSINYQAE
ncbi:hypothetical protein B0H66DRAFT_620719 [Apodospora peruviana]|uniref:Uncharacterized protein n=1 Tax=Apodospora peruviana TaxID=516989 RepID=A0AAE0M8X4_9PEZI|nr:hypothetical protein B0H66DRAFT_620719 [Apodospora peruviana]